MRNVLMDKGAKKRTKKLLIFVVETVLATLVEYAATKLLDKLIK